MLCAHSGSAAFGAHLGGPLMEPQSPPAAESQGLRELATLCGLGHPAVTPTPSHSAAQIPGEKEGLFPPKPFAFVKVWEATEG